MYKTVYLLVSGWQENGEERSILNFEATFCHICLFMCNCLFKYMPVFQTVCPSVCLPVFQYRHLSVVDIM